MTWTKLGAEMGDAALDLSDAAFRTHVEALIYSNRRLLDLLIPKGQVLRFAGTSDADLAVKELVDRGWWTDRGDAWWIGVHFPEWQRDAVQVLHRRAQLAEAQRRRRRHELDDHTLCLPGARCRFVSTVDAPVDGADDPERNGTVRKSSTRGERDGIDNWPDLPRLGGA